MSDNDFDILLMDTVLSPTSILIIENLERELELSKEGLKQKIGDINIEVFNYSLDKLIEGKIIGEKDNKLILTKSGDKFASEVKKVLTKFKLMYTVQN
jgi:hypothetical protein